MKNDEVKIECDKCYEYIEAKRENGIYECKNCRNKVELEILDKKGD